jgi:hypothetical protein
VSLAVSATPMSALGCRPNRLAKTPSVSPLPLPCQTTMKLSMPSRATVGDDCGPPSVALAISSAPTGAPSLLNCRVRTFQSTAAVESSSLLQATT